MGLLAWFRTAFSQDDFADDWYGWLTNQASHMGLGVMLALIASVGWQNLTGEYPVKWQAWAVITALYAGSEAIRGGAFWDAVEDGLFVCGYGCGGAFLVFSEITPGDPALLANAGDVIPILSAVSIHLLIGIWSRIG